MKSHIRTSPEFLCTLPVADVARSSDCVAICYVMYFRFYGWRHVFIPWDQWAESSTTLCLEEVRQMAVRLDVRQLQRLVEFVTTYHRGLSLLSTIRLTCYVTIIPDILNIWVIQAKTSQSYTADCAPVPRSGELARPNAKPVILTSSWYCHLANLS